MENLTLTGRPFVRNKGATLSLAKHLLSCFLLLLSGIFTSLNGQCPATISVSPFNVVCQGNNVFLTATADPGSTFLWSRNGVSMDSTRNDLVVTASGNYYVTTMPCGLNSAPVTITVNPVPSSIFTYSPDNTPCASTPIHFSGPDGIGISYSWNFGDPTSGAMNTDTAKDPDHVFEAYGNGTQSFIVQLTTTYISGCSSTSSQIVTVTQKPDVTLTDPNDFPPFTLCSLATDTLALTVQYSPLVITTNTQYQITWGDGSPGWDSISFPAAGVFHNYITVGTFYLVFTVTASSGCQNSKVYQVFNGSNPSLTVGNPGSTTGCIPATFTFPLDGWENNTPSTSYTFNFGDGSPVVVLYSPLPPFIVHTYTTSSCTQPPPAYTYIVTAVASNPCGSTPMTIGGIQVSERPYAYFTTIDSVFCITDNIHFTNLTNPGCFIVGNNTNNSTNFIWDFGDGTTQTFNNIAPGNIISGASPNHTYILPGIYTVSLTATNFGVGGCGDSTYTKQICISAQPNSSFTLSKLNGCQPLTVDATNSSTTTNLCHDRIYTWSVIFNGSLCDPATGNWGFAAGSDLHSTDPSFIFNDPGSYTIILAVQNHCQTVTSSTTVDVKSIPTITITPLLPICEQTTVNPTATYLGCYGTISGYSWTFPGGIPGSSNQQNPGSITYSTFGFYTITASATNECGTGSGNTILNVEQLPVITANPSSQTICSGNKTQAVVFSSSLPGTTYSWSATNPGGVGGVILSGTSNPIPVMTLTNPTNSLQTITYTIIPTSNGCQGLSITHVIMVNPAPDVINNPMTQSICSGETTTDVILTSSIAGTTFSWTASATAGISGFIASGTTTIPPQILITTLFVDGTVTYTITPSANGCDGVPVNYIITVKPVPQITNNPLLKTICSGSNTNIILTSTVAGSNFTWTASCIAGTITGFTASGSGNINQTLTNTGTLIGTVRYVIVPNRNGCPGIPTNFDVNVQPVSDAVANPSSQTICSGSQNAAIILTSNVPGTSFLWSATATPPVGISGFIASGSGNTIPSATISSLLITQGSITYTISPSIGGCTGTTGTTVILVDPCPMVTNNPMNQTVCSGNPTTLVTLTSNVGGTTFTWTASGTAGISGFLASGTNTIPSQTILNSGVTAGSVTYHIIPSSNMGMSCPGSPADYTINVNPLPAAIANPASQIICSGGQTGVSLNSNVPGTTFSWTASVIMGTVVGQCNGSGNSITETLTNTGNVDGIVRYTITPAAAGCPGSIITVDVTVHPTPVVITTPAISQTICSGDLTNIALSSNVFGSVFSWTATLTSGSVTGFSDGSGTLIGQTLINSGVIPGIVTYTIYASADGCDGPDKVFQVTVNPIPVLTTVPANNQSICSQFTTNIVLSSNISGTTYSWTGSLTSGTVTGFSSGTSNPIAQTLTNTGTSAGIVTYDITPGYSGCYGSIVHFPVTVNPLPITDAGTDFSIPYGTNTSLSGTGSGGTGSLLYSWVPLSDIASGETTLTPTTTNLFTITTFTLTITDSKGCLGNDQVIVSLIGGPLSVLALATPQIICNTGVSVQLDAIGSGGSGTYTYNWVSNPAGFSSTLPNPIVNPVVTTTYTVTIDDGFNTASSSVTVTVNPLPAVFSMTGGGEYCSGGSGIPIGLSGSETGILYQLLKDGSPVGGPLAGTGNALSFGNQILAGNYTVSAFNLTTTCLNTMAGNENITINPLPVADAGSNKIIPNGTSTTLSGMASGGTGTLNYSWTPAIDIASGINTLAPITTNLYTNTLFTLTVSDSKSCSTSDQMMVILTGNLLDVQVQVNPDTICLGDPVQLTSIGSGGSGSYTYSWVSNPPGSPVWNSNLQNPVVTPTQTTVYKVTINDGFNSASDSGTVIVLPLPTSYAMTGGGSYCSGESGIPVGVTGSETGVSYRLYRNGFATGFPIIGTGGLISFGNQSISGAYTVKGTRLITGCMNWMSDTATVIILPLPTQYLVTGGGTYPAGGSGVPVGLAASDIGVNYRLIHGTDTLTAMPGIPGTGGPLDFGNQTLVGIYFVIAQNATTGCMNEMLGDVTIAINPYPNLFSVFGGGDICQGSQGKQIGLDGSETGVQYILRRNGDSIASLPGTGDSLNFGIFNVSGTYTVKGINILNGLQKMMNGNAVINVYPVPIAYLMVPSGDTCPGPEVLLNGSQAGVNYTLLRGNDTISSIAGTGLFGFLNFGMQFIPGIYRIIGINVITGCKNDMIGTLTIHPAPALFTINPPGIICPGTHITLSGSEIGINYQLRRDSLTNVGTPLPGTGSILDFGSQTLPGVYRIIGINPLTLCYSWMNDNSTIQPQPILYDIIPHGDTCAGAIVRLNGSQTGILYRLVLNNTIYLDSLYGTGFPLVFGTYFTAGTYTIVAVNPISRCETVMNGALHISNAPTVYNVLPNGIACSGDVIRLDNSEIGVSYTLIRDGSILVAGPIPGTGMMISFGVQYYTGIYTVQAVNDLNGCSRIMNGSSFLYPLPTTFLLQPQGNQCSGSDLFINGSEIGINYELLWNGIVQQTLAGTGSFLHFGPQFLPGTYTVRAVNLVTTCDTLMNGITVITPLPLIFNVTPAGANCSPTAVGLDGSQLGVTYQLYKNGGPVGLPLAGTGGSLNFGLQTEGSYFVTGKILATTCADTMSGNVIITPGPTVEAGRDSTICYLNSLQLQGQASSTSSVLWTSSGDGVFADPFSLNTIYTTGANDKLNGTVKLFLRGFGQPECSQMQVVDSLTLTISGIPLVDAGRNDTICASQTAQLNGNAQFYSILNWRTSGDGTFNNPTILAPVYTPGTLDKSNGSVQLRITVHGMLNCFSDTAFDDMTLIIEKLPLANAGPDDTICENSSYMLAGAALNAASVLWTTTGDGIFSNPGILNAVYTAGNNDKTAGSVRLVLTVTGSQHCMNEVSRDTMKLMFNPFPIVYAGNDTTICSNLAFNVHGTSQHSSVTEWTSAGDGWFTDRYALNTIYHTGTADILNGSAILKLTAHGKLSCLNASIADSMVLTLHQYPTVSAGNDTLVCPNVAVQLNGTATNYTGIQWSSVSGDGTFDNPSILQPHYTPGTNDIATGFVHLKLTANGTQECSLQTSSDTVMVSFRTLPTASLNGIATICVGTLTNLTINLTGTSPWSVIYTDGLNNITVNNILTTPYTFAVSPTVTTTYTLLGVGDYFCNGRITGGSVTITVNPLPQAFRMTATDGGSYCEGGTGVVLGLDGSQTGISYQLLLGGMPDGFPIPGNGAPITFGNHTTPGIYKVHATNFMTSCQVVFNDSINLIEHPKPDVNFTADSTCNGQLTYFHIQGSDIGKIAQWHWNFGDGVTTTYNSPVEPTHLYPTYGVYHVVLSVTDTNGCSLVVAHDINVYDVPVSFFSFSAPICAGVAVTFSDHSYTSGISFIARWHWDFGDGSDTLVIWPGNPNITHIYNGPGTYNVTLTVTSNEGCSATRVRTISIDPHPVANFDFTAVCQDNITYFTDLSQTGGGGTVVEWYWNFGDPLSGTNNVSSVQNPVHIFSTPGDYTVRLNIITSNGCQDSIFKTLHVNQAPAPNFTYTSNCLGTPTQFTDMTVPHSAFILTWDWNFGDGSAHSSLQNPIHLYTNGGQYNVTLTIRNSNECTNDTTIKITILEKPTAEFQTDAPVCVGYPVNYTNVSNTLHGQIIRWEWNFGDGADIVINYPASPNVSHIFLGTGLQHLVRLTIRTTDSCENFVEHILNSIPAPLANFSYSEVACAGQDVQFTDLTQLGGGTPISTYTWNFNDPLSGMANISHIRNPLHNFSSAGIYNVMLVVSNNNLCSDTIIKPVVINASPVANFAADTACFGATTHFTDLSIANAPSLVAWDWNFGDGSVHSYGQNPLHLYAAAGFFTVTLTVTNSNGCPSTISHPVEVLSKPVAAFIAGTANCSGTPVVFTDQSYTSQGYINKWIWGFGDGSTVTILAPPPQYVYHTYANGGTYNVSLTVETSDNCQSTMTNVVTIFFAPVANFSNSNSNCEGSAVQFTDSSQPNGGGPLMAWDWNFGDPGSGTNNTSSQQNPLHIYNTGGNFNVTLIITNIHGCKDTITKPVTISLGPSVQFTADTVCKGNITHFTDHTIANNGTLSSWLWNFGDGTPNSTVQNPTHTYASAGIFNVTLTVTNSAGCHNDTSEQVLVNEVPDALFSYNGSCMGTGTEFQDHTTSQGVPVIQWHWVFGDGDTSDLQNPIHTYNNPGSFTVILTVTNSRGCNDQYSAPVTIFNRPTAAFSYFSTFCPAGRVTFADHSVSNGAAITDWFWTFEPGFFSTSPNPTYTYSVTNRIYPVSLVVTDANGCMDTIIDSTVFVKPGFQFTFRADTACLGTSTHFQPVNLAEGDSLHDLHWFFADPASGFYNTSNLYNPTHEFSGPGIYTVKLTAWDVNNCTDSVYKEVIVYPRPIANFTFDSIPHCDGTAVFYNISNGNGAAIDTLVWDFGDGTILTQRAEGITVAIHHYDQFGNYRISLKAINANGCRDTISKWVMINCITAGFNISDSINCSRKKVTFFDHSTPVNLIDRWTWDFGDETDTTYIHKAAFIRHTYTQPGDYYVKLYIRMVRNGMSICDTLSEQISVQPTTYANFSRNNVCHKDTARFVNLTDSSNYRILFTQWNFGEPASGNNDTCSMFNACHLYTNPGKYNVRLIVQNSVGCIDTLLRKVTVYKHPKADFTVPEVCSRESVVFKNLSQPGDTVITRYSWHFGDMNNPVDTSNLKSPDYIYPRDGIYLVHLLVKDAFGCSDTLTKHETVLLSPVSAFTIIKDINGVPGRIRMDNESINATLYEWDFGNGIKSNEEDPLITYANDGSYQIRLITWAANNCSDTTYLNYEFMYHNLFVPNALSPENVIPEVRIFKPIGVNLKEYHVEIFDAWGHLIWGSRLLDDDGRPTEGWDGTLNGEVMPQDTYVWKISATFKDGTVWEGSDIGKGTGKTMGTVTLIR